MYEAYDDDDEPGPTPWAVEILVGLFVAVALTAGGGTASAASAGIVRLAAIPVLAVALWRAGTWPPVRFWLWPTLLLAACVVLVAVQLIPLPPEIWRKLPGRQILADGYAAAGLAPPMLPISMTPQATFSALLGLLPPAAAFLAVLGLDAEARRRLALLVVLLALVSIGLGMLQIAGGERSELRFYAFTNLDSAVGFFANRNHQASFLVAAIPLVAAISASLSRRAANGGFLSILAVSAVVVLIIGVATTRSRAGVALLIPAFLAALAVTMRSRRERDGLAGLWPALALGAAIVVGGGLMAVFSYTPLAKRFASVEETRPRIFQAVTQAGLEYAPFGSGAGSFEPVYRIHESTERLLPVFVNHAHNDYAEIWLETSWLGLALVVAFIAWWAVSLAEIRRDWRSPGRGMQLAGAAIVAIYLFHSFADYPLRTSGALVVFALACGLMIPTAWTEIEADAGEL